MSGMVHCIGTSTSYNYCELFVILKDRLRAVIRKTVNTRQGWATMCDLTVAAHALTNLTDICVVFARCSQLPPPTSDCVGISRVTSVALDGKVQAAYGTFREVYASLGIAGSGGEELGTETQLPARQGRGKGRKREKLRVPLPPKLPDVPISELLPWAMLSRRPGCGRQVELVIDRRDAPQTALLEPIGRLLMYAPSGTCVRTVLYERGINASSGSSQVSPTHMLMSTLAAVDARDELFSVARALLPSTVAGLPQLVTYHAATKRMAAKMSRPAVDGSSAVGSPQNLGSPASVLSGGEAATSVIFLSGPEGLVPPKGTDPWCHARALLWDTFGAAVIGLPGQAIGLRYSAVQLARTDRRSVETALRGDVAPLSCGQAVRGAIEAARSRQARTRALAMLLNQVGLCMHAPCHRHMPCTNVSCHCSMPRVACYPPHAACHVSRATRHMRHAPCATRATCARHTRLAPWLLIRWLLSSCVATNALCTRAGAAAALVALEAAAMATAPAMRCSPWCYQRPRSERQPPRVAPCPSRAWRQTSCTSIGNCFCRPPRLRARRATRTPCMPRQASRGNCTR